MVPLAFPMRGVTMLEAAAKSRAALTMRTANYIFSVTSVVLGIALILFMLMQSMDWNIGIAIGLVLLANGLVRLWFAQDDK